MTDPTPPRQTTPGTPAKAPSRAQHDEWVRYVREIGYTHKRIRHDQQTAEQRAAWGHDDWHCICGSWGGPFGDYAYALHLEDVIREARAPITVEALARALLEAQEHGDHNGRCLETSCPVAAELLDVARRQHAALSASEAG